MIAGRKEPQVSCERKENKHDVAGISPLVLLKRTAVNIDGEDGGGISNVMRDVLKKGFEQDT